MISTVSIVALGFVLGVRHALDPDHVLAVTTIVQRDEQPHHAALIGVLWGLGHTLTISIVGGVIIAFNWTMPERLGLGFEFAVALMLIVLGVWTVSRLKRGVPAGVLAKRHPGVVHNHVHRHGDYLHAHPHGHDPETHPHPPDRTPLAALDRRFSRLALYHAARPLAVGVVHGLAGSATATLVILAAIHDTRWAAAYLLVFGLGTVAGMVLVTVCFAATFRYARHRDVRLARRLGLASGVASVAFGLYLAYHIGVVEGLALAGP
ncbi:MAG: high-affinity nickel-transport family protein [Acidobacteriota bacterium]